MSEIPTVFPLTWPRGRLRRGCNKLGHFKYKAADGWMKPVTIAVAVQRLQDEVWKLGGRNLLISSNLQVGKNGQPLSNQKEPGDGGVCAYFSLHGKAIALACDTYSLVAQNLAALAAHIDAVRAQERHGVASAEESLRAFEALVAPEGNQEKTWRQVFGASTRPYTKEEIGTMYRSLAKDCAGDEDALKELNIARDKALKEIA